MAKTAMDEKDNNKAQEKKPKAPQPAANVPLPKVKRGAKSFYREVLREMKHVTWPTRKENNRLTGVVITVCVLVTLYLTLISYGADVLYRLLVRGS